MSDFINTTTPYGRKDYHCEWCGEKIPKGERHVHFVGIWEGDWQNWRMHDECHESPKQSDELSDGWEPYQHERPRKEDSCCSAKTAGSRSNGANTERSL